jgi:hypothetical protein
MYQIIDVKYKKILDLKDFTYQKKGDKYRWEKW